MNFYEFNTDKLDYWQAIKKITKTGAYEINLGSEQIQLVDTQLFG